MSNTPVVPEEAAPAASRRGGVTGRSALVAAVIVVVIAGVVAFAHSVRNTANATPSASGSAMKMSSKPKTPMAVTSAGTSMSGAIPTVNGGNLPAMQSSGAMPMAMAMVPLGNATWDGMKIEARTSAPATFVLLNGTKQQIVKPTANTSFHLMILLSDKSTGVAIPYSSVWATVKRGNKLIFDERLWPMISRYMGPHYGNNVALPSAGVYQLSLLVSPPAAARHLEYKNLWLKPHKVELAFRWVPKSS